VSDIGMPVMDGYALIRRIRELPDARQSRVPAIALTAYARTEDRSRALSAGFQIHLPKPIEPAGLTEAISSLVRRT
jgi:CheY-like chemotaxis protein